MSAQSAPNHRLSAPYLLAPLLGLAGLGSTLAAFWPGVMTWDSVRQYEQALSGQFDDWHPPAMEWLWRQLLPIHHGPLPMLLLQLALFWAGVTLLIGWAQRERRPWLALGIVACAIMPGVISIMGAVVKDCLMAGASMAAIGVLAAVSGQQRRHLGWRMLGIALLVAASTLRFNAFMATAPIGIALVPPGWRDRWAKFALSTLVVTALMIAALPAANRLLNPEKSGVELSLVIFDLGGITKYSGVDVFPPLPSVKRPVEVATRCYTPVKWDSYSWWVDPLCPIEFYGIQDWFAQHKINPELFWVKAILAHPIAYAEHRWAHFGEATRFMIHKESEIAGQVPDAPNDWGFKVSDNPARRFINGTAALFSATPVEWPIVWIGLALAALLLSPGLPSARLIAPLATSSLLYGMGYAAVSVASEIRYHQWTMLLAGIANAMLISDVTNGARLGRTRVVLAYTPSLIVTALAISWRLLPA